MARSINRQVLLGNLGSDPECTAVPPGKWVSKMKVATSSFGKKDPQTGEREEYTDWHNVVAFDHLAKYAGEYLKKGDRVYIEGRTQTRKYTGSDGVERYFTEVVATEILGLTYQRSQEGHRAPPAAATDRDDDIPF